MFSLYEMVVKIDLAFLIKVLDNLRQSLSAVLHQDNMLEGTIGASGLTCLTMTVQLGQGVAVQLFVDIRVPTSLLQVLYA